MVPSHQNNPSKQQGILFLFLALWIQQACIQAWVVPFPTLSKKALFADHPANKAKKNALSLTYLEINGWLVTMGGVTIVIDPLLEGPLDFGIPQLYQGAKRVLPSSGITESLPPIIDCVLITQGLDDHAHVRTLQKLQTLDPTVPILAPPSAQGALEAAGFQCRGRDAGVQFLKHGQETTVQPRKGGQAQTGVQIRATEGALVGPPWQTPENGYTLRSLNGGRPSLYIEPHVEFSPRELARLDPVDVVIAPTSGQTLPAFELVHGPKDTIRLLETWKSPPKYVVPMPNGEIDVTGPVSGLVSEVGTTGEFEARLKESSRLSGRTEIIRVNAGEDTTLML